MTTPTKQSPPVPPLLAAPSDGRSPRVGVLTGSYGAGHNAAARELAAALRADGCTVGLYDIVDLLPWRVGRALRAVYFVQLRRHPNSWATTLRALEPGARVHGPVTRALGAAARRVTAEARGCDLVVTTHPFGAQALGRARATGQLETPTVTYLTDASVHPLWVHPGIDLNLAIHQVAADDARRWHAAATVVAPLTSEPRSAPVRDGANDPLASRGIVGPRALVTGGALGIGDLEQTCRDILATGIMTPVALSGTDEALRRRLSRIPGVVPLGWHDDVPAVMAASDCIVQNAGGFSSLEGLASGTPVITYRPLPGHGVGNCVNLEKAGLVPWARTAADLALQLAAAGVAPRVGRLPSGSPDLVSVLRGRREQVVAA